MQKYWTSNAEYATLVSTLGVYGSGMYCSLSLWFIELLGK
jgi:hypothetical protein